MRIAVLYPNSLSGNVVLIIDIVHAMQAQKGTCNICGPCFQTEAMRLCCLDILRGSRSVTEWPLLPPAERLCLDRLLTTPDQM
jgi:hypothetical protein